ncbi:MAG TPA: methyltransferase domain-containing protein [Acidimicrobiia bacterium]|jgi:ubiquinone/menaquinone biosynthesis C-methylase UbiE
MSGHEHDAQRDLVRESFSRQTALFSGPNSPFVAREASALAWVEPVGDEMIVLDVACGAAHVAEQIAPRVRQVVGIDLTAELLAIGAARLHDAGIRNVLLQEGDAFALPFVDASFDVVACRASLHHFASAEPALAEMARVCRPGGHVAISDLAAPPEEVRDGYDAFHRLLDPSHVGALAEVELAELMERTVGPITYGQTTSSTVPLDLIFSEVSDRAAVNAAIEAELAGGQPTGVAPVEDDGRILLTFTTTVLQAQPA